MAPRSLQPTRDLDFALHCFSIYCMFGEYTVRRDIVLVYTVCLLYYTLHRNIILVFLLFVYCYIIRWGMCFIFCYQRSDHYTMLFLLLLYHTHKVYSDLYIKSSFYCIYGKLWKSVLSVCLSGWLAFTLCPQIVWSKVFFSFVRVCGGRGLVSVFVCVLVWWF